MQYISPTITDNNKQFVIYGERYMKATGIVRRIEACVIIGQTVGSPHKH